MNNEILNEINRFREISGLKLLSEASIGGGWIDELLTVLGKSSDDLDTFIKNSDDVLAAEMRTSIDDVASRLGRPVDELLERIKLKNLATDEADEILKSLLKSTNKEVKDTLANYYINNDTGLKEIADEMVNGDVVDLLKTSQLPYNQLNDLYKSTRESFVRSLSDELPEIQENLLKRFDNTVKPLLDDIAKRSATVTAKKVTLSSIKENTNNLINSIRPKTYSEQFEDVLSQIQKERTATKQTPLTIEQIEAVEGYITGLLGKETGTMQEVLVATQKKLDELINIAKTGDDASKKEAKKQLVNVWRTISCRGADGKFLGFKECGGAIVGTAIGISFILLAIELEMYGDSDHAEDIKFVKSKLPCLGEGDVDVTLAKDLTTPDTAIDSLVGTKKEIKIKGKDSKGMVKWIEIYYDTTSKKFKDATGNPISCPEGSVSDGSGFIIGDGTSSGDGGGGGIAAPTDTEFKEWAKIEYKDYPESLEKINAVTPTISGNNVIIVVDGNTLTYTKTADKTFVQQ